MSSKTPFQLLIAWQVSSKHCAEVNKEGCVQCARVVYIN